MKINKGVLSQKEYDKIASNKNTINLSGRSTSKQRKERIQNRIRGQKGIRKWKAEIKLLFAIVLLVLVISYTIKVYGDIEPIQQEKDPLLQLFEEVPEIEEIIQDNEAPILGTKELLKKNSFDINKLAYAVAYHETKNCTLGYGKEYNNCFGIKQNRTARCDKVGRNNMCIFKKPEDSYVAFKIIWSKWYGELPNIEKAKRWSGNDRAKDWLNNVLHIYNKNLG